jgi:hypothetical protein
MNIMKKNKVILKISENEFEMEDGVIHPILFEIPEHISLEEFQNHYNQWQTIFYEKGLLK